MAYFLIGPVLRPFLSLADALTKALALPQFMALVARMRRQQVLGGRALSAMRAAMAWVARGRAADEASEEAAAPLPEGDSPVPGMTPMERAEWPRVPSDHQCWGSDEAVIYRLSTAA